MNNRDLLHEMLSELAAPLLLVGRDKGLRYASPAFRQLAGIGDEVLPCDSVLHPATSALTAGHCCWDVLNTYLAAGESALWQLRDGQGGWLPVLCDIRTIEVAHKSVMIAIKASPLRGLASPIALSFFRCMRRSASGGGSYEKNAADYLRKHFCFGQVLWPRSKADTAPTEESSLADSLLHAIEAIDPQVRQNGLFDIIAEQAGRERIFHVFQSPEDAQPAYLAVSDTGRRLSTETICALRAAVVVWAEAAEPQASSRRAISPALIELLSSAEREILDCLRAGMCDKEIANLRRASVNTVRNQVNAVMHKLGVNKRTHIAGWNY